jgi:S-adenosylmethionine:tRNA ribosyltransferase-isomerase
VRLDEFDFPLTGDRIARVPAERREAARLLVMDRESGSRTHTTIDEFSRFLKPGDLVVVNDVRVGRARIHLRRPTGARVEGLVLKIFPAGEVRVLLDGKGKLRDGMRLAFEGDAGVALELIGRDGEAWRARVAGASAEAALERLGHVPIPPYIRRARRHAGEDEADFAALDRERYQTVFAESGLAVAAPTAGLHLGRDALAAIEARGARLARVRLEVGAGTFAPIRTPTIEEHKVDAEAFAIPNETAAAVERARRDGGRIVAVGTTVVRTLESAALDDGRIRAGDGSTDLTIRPGFRFRVVDALLTNFHLPQSSLLVLVSAFAGRERVLDLYGEAVREGYRFYSYGDATLFL